MVDLGGAAAEIRDRQATKKRRLAIIDYWIRRFCPSAFECRDMPDRAGRLTLLTLAASLKLSLAQSL